MLANINTNNSSGPPLSYSDNMAHHQYQDYPTTPTIPVELMERDLASWSNHYKTTKNSSDKLAWLFKLRAEAEWEYAEKLRRLSELEVGEEDQPWSLRQCLQSTKAELASFAKHHSELADKIQSDLYQPTAQLMDRHAQQKRGGNENLGLAKHSYLVALELVDQARHRYQTEHQDPGELAHYESRYQQSVRHYSAELDRGTNSYKQLEAARIQFLRNALWNYTNLMSSTCVLDDESSERIRSVLEKCDGNIEVEGLSKAFTNGSPASGEISQPHQDIHQPTPNVALGARVQPPPTFDKHLNSPHTLATVPERGSPLRNEIRKPNQNRIQPGFVTNQTQLGNSEQGPNIMEPARAAIVQDRTKLISNDLVTATIARSPILQAKRSSTSGSARTVTRTPTLQPNNAPPTTQALVIGNTNTMGYNSDPRIRQNMERSGSNLTHQQQQPLPPHPNQYPPQQQPQTPRTPQAAGYGVTSPEQPYQPQNGNSNGIYRPAMSQGYQTNPTTPNPNHQQFHRANSQKQTQPPPNHIPQQHQPQLQPPHQPPHQQPPQQHQPPPQQQQQQPPPVTPSPPTSKPSTRPILFYVRAMYDYDAEVPEEISLAEGQLISVLATQLDGWWEGEVRDNAGGIKRGIFPSNFTEPVSL